MTTGQIIEHTQLAVETYIKDTEREVEDRSVLDDDLDKVELDPELFYQEITHKKKHLLLDS